MTVSRLIQVLSQTLVFIYTLLLAINTGSTWKHFCKNFLLLCDSILIPSKCFKLTQADTTFTDGLQVAYFLIMPWLPPLASLDPLGQIERLGS
jgi:hypothetical protein